MLIFLLTLKQQTGHYEKQKTETQRRAEKSQLYKISAPFFHQLGLITE